MKRKSTRLIFLVILIAYLQCFQSVLFASSGFGVVQDPANIIDAKTMKLVDEIMLPMQQESSGMEFHFMLVPSKITDSFGKLARDVASNYQEDDRKSQTVFLMYKLSDHSYQFIIDDTLKEKISPVFLTFLMEGDAPGEAGMKAKFQAGSYNEGVLEYVPRLMAYFSLSRNFKVDQQNVMAGAAPVSAENFVYKRITDFQLLQEDLPKQEAPTPKNRSSLWFFVILGTVLLSVIAALGYRHYKKRQEDREFELGNIDDIDLEDDGRYDMETNNDNSYRYRR